MSPDRTILRPDRAFNRTSACLSRFSRSRWPVLVNLSLHPGNERLAAYMSTEHHHATSVSLPPESAIAKTYTSMSLADAYSIELPTGVSTNPELLARFIFAHQAPWISSLMMVRDALVAGFGLKTAKHLASLEAESRVGRLSIFKIYSTSPTEIVLGEDDKHLDFRLSVLCSGQSSPGAKRHLILSTVVHCHNR